MAEAFQLHPLDLHNRALLENVHPPSWKNPTPARRYHLVVVGGGTAGLVTAAGAAGLGARVALVERGLLGGDCLNHGCVPSKALLRAARAWADVRDARYFGVEAAPGSRIDFEAVMARMRRLRASISRHDSAERFRRLGVDVFLGEGRFTAPDTVEVEGASLHFSKACIATGSRPSIPPIPGLSESGCLTNETVFSLTALPANLAVIGGGPIGCELGQAFARFGSRVTLLEAGPRLLGKDEPEAAARVERALAADGVRIALGVRISRVTPGAPKRISSGRSGREEELEADQVLVATGRAPNVQGLGLEAAEVAHDPKKGVLVNDRLQTSNRRIYAAGDVCSPYQFTHAADAMARIVIRNALFHGRARATKIIVPWCTYTDPELAHVGMSAEEARAKGIAARTLVQEFQEVDRAVLDGEPDGLLRVHVEEGSDRILGATLVARHAGEMLSEVTLAMVARRGMKTLSGTIHPYPTQAEAFRKVADAWQRGRLKPWMGKLLRWWFSTSRTTTGP